MFNPNESRDCVFGGGVRRAVGYVSAVARKLLSPQTSKFVEAGYLTECMSFTPKFDEAVRLIALEQWGDELEVLADAEIAANSKEVKS